MAFTLAEALQGVAVTFNADGLVGLMHINERGIQSDTPTVIFHYILIIQWWNISRYLHWHWSPMKPWLQVQV